MAKEAAVGGGGGKGTGEAMDLKKENEELKQKLSKQEYRIRHLIEGMEELLAQRK
jgi:hypothetical protein